MGGTSGEDGRVVISKESEAVGRGGESDGEGLGEGRDSQTLGCDCRGHCCPSGSAHHWA